MTSALVAILWVGSGFVGGRLLDYPGDGFTMRPLLGAGVGPIALGLALWERAFPD